VSDVIKLQKFQYSSSKRACAKKCWLQYYHRYVAKTYPFEESPPILIGHLCDREIETAIATGQDPDLDAIADEIVSIDPGYKYVESLVEGIDAAYEYAITRTGLRVMQASLALNRQLKPTATDWREKSPLFDAAKMDLITIIGDETVVYVDDWKSGNPNYPDFDQLADYALYIFVLMPKVTKVVASLVWLRKGRHAEQIVHKSEQVFDRENLGDTVKRWALMHADTMDNNEKGEWPATYNEKLCGWCDHYDFCPEAEQYR